MNNIKIMHISINYSGKQCYSCFRYIISPGMFRNVHILYKGGEKMIDEQKWFDPKSLEAKRGFSRSRQATLRSEGKIPYYRIGRYIRYLKTEIDEWILSHKVV